MSAHLVTLERLLAISVSDLKSALIEASDLVAAALRADKVDTFLYDAQRDTLVAVGTSRQPLSDLERRHGLDVLPVSNGGRAVEVYVTGQTFSNGHIEDDPNEVRGIKEALKVRSEIGVALDVAGNRRGVLLFASNEPDRWTPDDVRFAESVARWVSSVIHQADLVEEVKRGAVVAGRRSVAEELVTIVAHDLRNLIFPVDLLLQLIELRADHATRTDDVRDAAKARRGLARLDALVNDILDVARLEQGALAVETRPTALLPLVRAVASVLQTPEQPIVVEPDGDLFAAIDLARIRQCLENLVANALKHSPAAVPVVIALSRRLVESEEFACIDVVDQGSGVPPDILPFIFDRFVTRSGPDQRGGLGLGLFLARQIALLHGGDLTVESTPGRGARFTLMVPVGSIE